MLPICSDDPLASIARAVFDEVRRAAPEGLNFDLTLDSSLEEAGLDSLARMHVANCLEEAFHIRFSEDALYDIDTCRDLVAYIASKTAPPATPPAAAAPIAAADAGKAAGKGRRRRGEEHIAGML